MTAKLIGTRTKLPGTRIKLSGTRTKLSGIRTKPVSSSRSSEYQGPQSCHLSDS
jgi:hypothetical protein